MKTKLSLALAGLVSVNLGAASVPAPNIEWQQSFGGDGGDRLKSIRETFDGGYILSGNSGSPRSGNKTTPHFGYSDLWVLRLGGNGQILWQKTFGGDQQDGVPCAIRQTSNGGFILAGQSRSGISGTKATPLLGAHGYFDLWVICLDPDGGILWQASFGGSRNEFFASALEETSDGGFILGGYSDSEPSGNKSAPYYGNQDYWLVRLDRNGFKLWDRTFGGVSDDRLYAVQQTADGGFILGGESSSPPSGNKTSPNLGSWVIRVDPNGDKLWEKSYGGNLNSLAQTGDGGFAFCGFSRVVRTDANGEILWDKAYGSGILNSLQTTLDGGFILGGYSDATGGNKTSPSFGRTDYWVIRTDGLGNSLWQLSLGGTNEDLLFDLRQTSDGGFVAAGESRSSTNGNKTSPNFGHEDYWVVKIAAEDFDADGVPDFRDPCPDTPPGDVVNDTGCSIDQLAPCDGPWRNHGEYVQAIIEISEDFLRAGLISQKQCSAIIHQAAKSDCGGQALVPKNRVTY